MVVKFSNGTFNESERRRAIVSDTLASNFQPNEVAYGENFQLKRTEKVTKVYKMVTKWLQIVKFLTGRGSCANCTVSGK
jgi:hypothetical protein